MNATSQRPGRIFGIAAICTVLGIAIGIAIGVLVVNLPAERPSSAKKPSTLEERLADLEERVAGLERIIEEHSQSDSTEARYTYSWIDGFLIENWIDDLGPSDIPAPTDLMLFWPAGGLG